jgi:hypothetical protein
MGAMLDGSWTGETFAPATPTDIGTIEAAIVERLRSQINSIEIIHYPDRPETWRLTHRVGAAMVMYKGATYGERIDTAAVIQERTLEFEVAILMRDLGWSVGGSASGLNPGAYAIIEAVRGALTGYAIAGCRKMYPTREKFVERDKQGGVWTYALSFAVATIAIEQAATNDFPLFIKGVALDEGGLTAITVGASAYVFDQSGKIQLPHQNIFALIITAAGGAQLIQGTDFETDRVQGIVSIIAGGAASVGETVQIAYAYAEQATAESGDSQPIN